jgi:hypothetical protein
VRIGLARRHGGSWYLYIPLTIRGVYVYNHGRE